VLGERALAGAPGHRRELRVAQRERGERLLGGAGDEHLRRGVEGVEPLPPVGEHGTPHAAASNSRPDGHHPIAAIAPRVMLSVRRLDA
jgi:hypothetical protein